MLDTITEFDDVSIGEELQLKSGSPNLIVTKTDYLNETYSVAWINEDGILQEVTLSYLCFYKVA